MVVISNKGGQYLKTYEEKCKEVEEAKKELAELIKYFEENGINYDPPKELYRRKQKETK